MEGELKRRKNLDETVWSSAASQSFRFSNRLNSGSDGSTQAGCARAKFRGTPLLPDSKSGAKIARLFEYRVPHYQKEYNSAVSVCVMRS